jgi:hypothetical protein
MIAMIWALGPIVGVLAGFLALRWALRSHRADRRPWLALIATSGAEAASRGGVGAIDGIAAELGAAPALDAPFSGRKCVAFHIEIIEQDHQGNRIEWNRVFEDGAGEFAVISPAGQPVGAVNFRGGSILFPTPLTAFRKLAARSKETVFQGALEAAPPHLQWFVRQLPPDIRAQLGRSGGVLGTKRLYFNERIVVPCERVVVAGHCESGPNGVNVFSVPEVAVALGFGDLASERARLQRLPVGEEAFGAVFAGVLACGATEMLVAMFFAN